jgi:PAS domain S-box-containing protein
MNATLSVSNLDPLGDRTAAPNDAPPAPGARAPVGANGVAPVSATFRNILRVVCLIFAFAVVQTVVLWQACNRGMRTAMSLEDQGLPTLDALASLQEHLAVYRLNSYEYLFAPEADRPRLAQAADVIAARARAEVRKIQLLVPDDAGREVATSLSAAIEELDGAFRKVRGLVDADFAAAMKAMDQEIPPRVDRVATAANALKAYGYQFSGDQANATFASFGWIKQNAVWFGAGNILVALGAVVFVRTASRRTRAKLTETLARLDERSAELASSLSLTDATLESTIDGILVLDNQGEVTKHNRRFAELWRMPPDVLAAPNRAQFLHVALEQVRDPAGFHQFVEKARAQRELETFDVVELKDGRVFERHSKPQRLGATIVGRVWCLRDVTERKRAEESLRLLSSAVEQCKDSVLITDAELDLPGPRILFVNSAFTEMTGYTSAEAIGRTPRILQGPHTDKAVIRRLRQNLESGEKFVGEGVQYRKDGTEYHQEWHIAPIQDAAGKITHYVAVQRDITKRKQAEADLVQAHTEMVGISRQAGMAEIATGVLHNVGNVLNSVNVSATLIGDIVRQSKVNRVAKLRDLFEENKAALGTFLDRDPRGRQVPAFVSSLADHLTQEQTRQLAELESLRKNVEHIKDIVAMQQNYARVSGVAETVDLAALIEDAIRMNAESFTRHGVEIECDFQAKPTLTTDKHKVLQILINLLRNAKQACNETGHQDRRIVVRVTAAAGRCLVAVIDNGIGISPENLTRIFAHGFTTKKTGHGFGLHSGANAAKEIGGALRVQSDGAGCGATFTLELPVQPAYA